MRVPRPSSAAYTVALQWRLSNGILWLAGAGCADKNKEPLPSDLALSRLGNWNNMGGGSKGRCISFLSPSSTLLVGTQPFPHELGPFLEWGWSLPSSVTRWLAA